MRCLNSPAPWTFVSVIVTFFFRTTLAQTSINGQIFTNGLAIIDSPAVNTPFTVGSTLPIAIEVSGNGKLPPAAVAPSSGQSTRFDLLEIFLVSSQTQLNVTVSVGPGLLTGETGTVRHLNWPIPTCITKGYYNLTFYEASHIDNQAYFAITPIPVTIDNNADQSSCTLETNPLQDQPQTSSPISQFPFVPASAVTTVGYRSTITLVTTAFGQPTTTTFTTTFTTTMLAGQNTSGFFPVNTSLRNEAWPLNLLMWTMFCLALVYFN